MKPLSKDERLFCSPSRRGIKKPLHAKWFFLSGKIQLNQVHSLHQVVANEGERCGNIIGKRRIIQYKKGGYRYKKQNPVKGG
jgi:hypothetical protein